MEVQSVDASSDVTSDAESENNITDSGNEVEFFDTIHS